MKSYKVFYSVVSLWMVLFSFGHPAQAQKLLEQFQKPLPKVTLTDPEVYKKEALMFEGNPAGLEGLAYRIFLPKEWKKNESMGGDVAGGDSKIMRETARFDGPFVDMVRPWIEVKVGAIDYNMTARDWFVRYILDGGYGLEGVKEYGNKRAEALYVQVKNSETLIVRGTVFLSGDNFLFIASYVPSALWGSEKLKQANVHANLALVEKDVPFSEETNVFKFLDIAQVSYPASWTLKSVSEGSIERMYIQLFNYGVTLDRDERKLNGKIHIQMLSVPYTASLEEEMEHYRRDSERDGMALGDVIEEPEDFILNPRFDFALTEVYRPSNTTDKLIDYEYWITVVSMQDYYYFVSLLTPSRNSDYFLWSKNKEQYRAMINSIKREVNTVFEEEGASQ